MSRDQLLAFLKIRPEESRMAVLVAGLFLYVMAGQAIGENAAFALFLASVNVDYLPYMYMGLGGIVFLVSALFSASLSRFQNASVVRNLLGGAAMMFVVEWIAILIFDNPYLFPLLWLTTYGMSVVFSTLLWTTAGEVCNTRQAKRLFPLFTSMGILGSVLGNLITGQIASLAGTESLILFYAILLAGGFILLRKLTDSFFTPEEEVGSPFSMWNDLQAGYDFVRNSQLFRLLAFSSILYSILYFTVDFPFSEQMTLRFTDDAAGLAGFKGLFTSVTTAVTFLVSLFIANRLYARIGVVNSVLIMPIMYVVAFALFFISFTFWGAVAARFGQLVVLGGVAGTAWNALFNVVPLERRGQVLAFNGGVPAQIGVVLSGVLIVLSRQILETQEVLLLGAVVALAATSLTLRMRNAYGDALLDALRAGRTDVFGGDEEALTGYKNDPAAMQVILKSLQDPRAETRVLAADMLGRLGDKLAIPDLIDHLTDENPQVRAASIRALANLGAHAAARIIIRKLHDPDDFVREETLSSLPRLGVMATPELIVTLKLLSKERKNLRIKSHAAVVLICLGYGRSSRGILYRLLRNKNVNKRNIGLDAIRHVAEYTGGNIPFRSSTILKGLQDWSPLIRRETIRVYSLLNDATDYDTILQYLADEDERVRKNASDFLRKAWPETQPGIVRVLEEMNPRALGAALDSIPVGEPHLLEVLRGYIQREVSNIWYLRTLMNSFPPSGRVVALLMATLEHRVLESEERLIKAVGLFGNPRALEIVRKSLRNGDANTRAAALEALETLGDPTITREVLPILDRGGVFVVDKDQKMDTQIVIGGLLDSTDYWLRAISSRVVDELKLTDYVDTLKRLKSDPVPLVSQSAVDALARMDGGRHMKTLKTLSALDRILLLREVPMFTLLSPEDLEKIADVASEQLFPKKSEICREGDYGDSMFIIADGEVQVIKNTDHGETVLAVRGDGEFVGEMAILESSTRSATLLAATDVRMLVIDGASFKSILRDRPEVAISVLQQMSRRVRDLNERIQRTA